MVLAVGGRVTAQTIAQGYVSDTSLQRATIVSLSTGNKTTVEPASLDNEEHLQGVVVAQNDAPVTLSAEDVSGQVFVADGGRFEVLVSNENGAIQTGDYIAVSRVSGIGMKASESSLFIIGRAVSGFDGQASVLSTTTFDDNGSERRVAIGRVQADISIAVNPLLKPTEANLPSFLERVAEDVAQKPVNPVRVYLSLLILLITGATAGTLLYAGIRSGIVAIGRNPLSKKSITKSLVQVVLTSIVILLLGIFGVFLLLRI